MTGAPMPLLRRQRSWRPAFGGGSAHVRDFEEDARNVASEAEAGSVDFGKATEMIHGTCPVKEKKKESVGLAGSADSDCKAASSSFFMKNEDNRDDLSEATLSRCSSTSCSSSGGETMNDVVEPRSEFRRGHEKEKSLGKGKNEKNGTRKRSRETAGWRRWFTAWELVLPFLTLEDMVRGQKAGGIISETIRCLPLRLDKNYAPMPYDAWVEVLGGTNKWNITGIRLQGGLAGALEHIITPRSLEFLQVHGPKESTESIAEMPNLKEILLFDDHWITSLHTIVDALPMLRKIRIKNCRSLIDISALSRSRFLEQVEFIDCRMLESLDDLQLCSDLRKVVFSGLPKLNETAVEAVFNCPRLVELYVLQCPGFLSLDGLDQVTGLEVLKIEQCPQVFQLPDLSGCKRLRVISLKSCPQLHITPQVRLNELPALDVLDLSNTFVQSLSFIRGSQSLRAIDLSLCLRLTSIDDLMSCPNLQMLSLWRSSRVRSLFPARRIESLKWVDVSGLEQGLVDQLRGSRIDTVLVQEKADVFLQRCQIQVETI